jgi:hypothetical protein
MKNYLSLLFSALLLTIVSCSSTKIANKDDLSYSNYKIINSKKNIEEFLTWYSIPFDSIWIVTHDDVINANKIIKKALIDSNGIYKYDCLKKRYKEYNKEIAGYYKNGNSYIIAYFIVSDNSRSGDKFTIILDGLCGVIRIIINQDNDIIDLFKCNGRA